MFYCKNHFAQRFKQSGNYDGSFIESNPKLPADVDTTTTKRFSAVATGTGDQISWGRYSGLGFQLSLCPAPGFLSLCIGSNNSAVCCPYPSRSLNAGSG